MRFVSKAVLPSAERPSGKGGEGRGEGRGSQEGRGGDPRRCREREFEPNVTLPPLKSLLHSDWQLTPRRCEPVGFLNKLWRAKSS